MSNEEQCGNRDEGVCLRPVADIIVYENPLMGEIALCTRHLIAYMKDQGMLK